MGDGVNVGVAVEVGVIVKVGQGVSVGVMVGKGVYVARGVNVDFAFSVRAMAVWTSPSEAPLEQAGKVMNVISTMRNITRFIIFL